jgi:hypothetical protein
MQLHRRGERGGSKINTVFTLLILAGMVFVAIKIVPPFFNNYQFQDSLNSEARFAIANTKGADDIREDIWKKAQELSIPLNKREDIVVSVDRFNVSISADYTVAVDIIVYQFALQFHPHADNHTI